MFLKVCRNCVQLLGGLAAGLAIIALLIAWQLNSGPVSLSFLTPYVEKTLNSGHRGFRLAFDDTTLTWAGWDRAVELRITNVRAVGDNGSAMASIPELSLSLSGSALFRGELAPRFIELLGPELLVRRGTDGNFDFKLAQPDPAGGNTNVAGGLLRWLLQRPETGSPMSFLETVRISSATITYEDQSINQTWTAPIANVRLDRAAHGLIADGSISIELGERVAEIDVTGSFHQLSSRVDATATFVDIAPSSLAALDPALSRFSALDLPLSGTVLVGFSAADGVETVGFNIEGGTGSLSVPAPAEQTLNVEKVVARGLYTGDTTKIVVDDFSVDLADGSTVRVPLDIPHDFPVRRISGKGTFDGNTGAIAVRDLVADLDGVTFSANLDATLPDDGVSGAVAAKAELLDVPIARLKTYWPQSLGNDAWVWITNNFQGGQLERLTADLSAALDENFSPGSLSLNGTMKVSGVSVSYLEGLPAVDETKAMITYDETSLDIALEGGRTGDIVVAGGTVYISGLQEADQYADIDVRIESSVRDALTLIDREPLGFMKKMGIDPQSTSGDGVIDLSLRLLLAKDLAIDDVEVLAVAETKDVTIEGVVLQRDIENARLNLRVDKNGMDVSGYVEVGPIPAALTWRENFDDDPPFRSSYILDASIADVGDLRHFGVDTVSLTGDYVSGGADARVRYTVFDDRNSRVEVFADIAQAELKIPMLEWRKAPGDPGRASVTLLIENGFVKNVPSFEINAGDLSVVGDIVYTGGGIGLERINFDRIRVGRSDVSGAIISKPDGGWELGLQGGAIDASPLWSHLTDDDPIEKKDKTLPNLTVAVEFDKMWIDRDRFLTDVSGTFVHRHDIWRTVFLDSKMDGVDPLKIRVTPDDTGNRTLLISANDAGQSLRFLDLYEDMYGGSLEIRGRYDDAVDGHPLRGKLVVDNYRIRNAPIVARILSIMALTGILDAMTGEGLSFGLLEIPFAYREGVLQINNAKATGTSLGLTASGTVYTHADVVRFEGTVVPAYAINSLLGKIPLLGNIFTGTEEGGGVFAANFSVSGPIEDPSVTVNPLSALTPGIFRNLFGALDGKDQSTATQPLLGTPEPEQSIPAR